MNMLLWLALPLIAGPIINSIMDTLINKPAERAQARKLLKFQREMAGRREKAMSILFERTSRQRGKLMQMAERKGERRDRRRSEDLFMLAMLQGLQSSANANQQFVQTMRAPAPPPPLPYAPPSAVASIRSALGGL